uniref:Uncharacterized protein n=1 Tax=Glossina austeni TaxID=7395 RepID=A0A1A9VNC9_GLOAU
MLHSYVSLKMTPYENNLLSMIVNEFAVRKIKSDNCIQMQISNLNDFTLKIIVILDLKIRKSQEAVSKKSGLVFVLGWLVAWLAGWLGEWLVGWLAGWLGGWVAGWLAGWLGGTINIMK